MYLEEQDKEVQKVWEVLLTVDEAAKRLALGRTMVYELIANGTLQSLKIGRARRIPASSLDRWVMQQIEDNVENSPESDSP